MMWRRHHLIRSVVQQLPRRRCFGPSLPSAAATIACRSNGGGHNFFYSTCVSKTSAAIFGSSHLQYWTPTIQSKDRTCDCSLQSAARFSTNKKPPPRFSDDSNIDELVQIAHDNLDVMTPMATAALWNKISRQMNSRDGRSHNHRGARKGDSRQNTKQIDVIFQHTINKLGEFSMRELTQTIFSMSKITAALQKQGKRRGREVGHKGILRELLLNRDMTPKEDVFRLFAGWSMDKLGQFDARHLSNLAYAYALIRYVPEFKNGTDLFDHIAKHSIGIRGHFEPQGFSNMVWAYATVGKPHGALFEAMGDEIIATKTLKEFKPQALSNTVWAYATAGINHPKLFEKVANLIVQFDHLDRFGPQALANTVWAYATADIKHSKLFKKVANHIVESDSLNRFTHPQDFSNTVWAYATAGINHPRLFEKMANHIVQSDSLNRFTPQDFSNTVWAYATAGINHPRLFEKMANHIVQSDSLDRFKPQALSNTVWAYATAGINHPRLFEKVASHIVQSDIINRFKPQDVSNTVWAYATAGINHPKLFEAVANHIVQSDHLDRFKPQELSNTVWSYANAQVSYPKLFQKVANHIVQSDSLDRFGPQNLANTVWAYATAGINHPRLFDKMANHIVQSDSLDRFSPQNLTNTVWAYATAQVSHSKLFQKVAKAAIHRREKFNSQNVANLLWAYSTMGTTDKQLFSSFVPTAAKLVDSCNNQDVANVAWAYTVADVDAPTFFNDVFINKCVVKRDGFVAEALRQLYQWHLWQTKEKSSAGPPQDLCDSWYEAFISEDPTISKLQDDVVSQLTSLDLEPEEEVLMDSGYRIDAIVEVNGKTIGVEVDGPSHFIGKGRSPTGSTILKRRQVPAIDGIELVSIPYWDWNRLGKSQTKKLEYLRKLLGLVKDN